MMKFIQTHIYIVVFFGMIIQSCNEVEMDHNHHDEHAHESSEELVTLNETQFSSMEFELGVLTKRNMGSYVEVNGRLEVPPQNEASVTAIIGANVSQIKVIEGDKIEKGGVLAYLSHPDLIKVQTDYLNQQSQLEYIEADYNRQKQLYEEKVGSGRDFQRAKADYLTKKGMVKGLESQLKLMGLNMNKILEGHIYELVPVKSPIEGYIRKVEVKTGQFVQPHKEMFEVVNIEHIHADFMVFEKDMHKVEEGQIIAFQVSSLPNKTLRAKIHSVGKSFEEDPKAIHLHAEIENKEGLLIPGMYARGRILLEQTESYAIPEEGVVREGNESFIFIVKKSQANKGKWQFAPLKVLAGKKDNNWVEVKLLEPFDKASEIAYNNAYYIMAELKKEEAEHSH